ncbi:hypothetical protein TWF679_004273 [Orbilia oligospora]|uniref:Uncharacterized protein n=1 Tax=Orbilia oligospora TaxID=2813651 RepID=A0A8H8VMF9_ORBOL|nr:hypothetical protein TWF679_004273 [Orbilia oligospora]
MPILMSKGAALAAFTLLAAEISAYTLSFYGNAACLGVSRWQHSTTNDSTYMTPCEQIPASAGNGVISALLAGDATDNHWGYTAQLFSDLACNSQVTTISSKDRCKPTGAIRSFVVVGTESNFRMPEGTWNTIPREDAVSYTVNTVESTVETIGGDAVYNETEIQYYEADNYGGAGGSSGSSSYIGSSGPEPVMYPLDDASLEYATTNDYEAGIPGTVDEAVLEADCGDTVQEEGYVVDKNGDGLADATIEKTTTTDTNGNIVGVEQKVVSSTENLKGPGAAMDAPTVGYVNVPDQVRDSQRSGTSTSTGWPAAAGLRGEELI